MSDIHNLPRGGQVNASSVEGLVRRDRGRQGKGPFVVIYQVRSFHYEPWGHDV